MIYGVSIIQNRHWTNNVFIVGRFYVSKSFFFISLLITKFELIMIGK